MAWREHAEGEGGVLRWVERIGERSGVARLVADADRQQQHDPAYLEELRRWTAPERVAEGASGTSITARAAGTRSADEAAVGASDRAVAQTSAGDLGPPRDSADRRQVPRSGAAGTEAVDAC